MKTTHFLTAASMLFLVGCGGSGQGDLGDNLLRLKSAPAEALPPAPELVAGLGVKEDLDFVAQQDPKGAAGGQPEPPKAGVKVARKIKHTADLKLITEEFDKHREEIQQLVTQHDGYEAMADVRSSPGAPRVGTWRVRVPVEKLSAFRDAVRKLGEVESDTLNTEDLTDQYYDLDANIKNLKAEQDSWRDMLKRTSDKLENLISVKKELDRVTDEIQRKEGRLRLMANLTDLTTVNITLRERQKYVAAKGPDAVENATFGMKAGKTFGDSWGALSNFGEAVALFFIALAPWLPVILVVAAPAWYVWRQRRRQVPTVTAVPVTPAAPSA